MADFAAQLKQLRKKHNMTQETLAEILGMRKTTISNYEIGYSKPSYDTLQRLAQIFDVSIDILTGKSVPLSENISADSDRIDLPIITSENELSSANTFSVPFQFLGSGSFFVMQLEDDALSVSNLHKGDLVLFRRESDIKNGTLAAVLIAGKTKTVRYFYRADGRITLLASEKSPPEVFDEKEVTILGKAVKAFVSLDD